MESMQQLRMSHFGSMTTSTRRTTDFRTSSITLFALWNWSPQRLRTPHLDRRGLRLEAAA